MYLLPHIFLGFATSTLASVISQTKRTTVCNGHAELCARSYGNVTYLGSHDSFAFSEDPLALARDQEVDIPSQLALGVRFLQAQAHMKDGQLHFCHTDCILFDGGLVVDYLKKVKAFLDSNPNEVITLLFTNPEGVSITDVWKPAFDNAGITSLAFVPPHQPMTRFEWPTLGELIDSGKRVIVFLDAGAENGGVDFILPEFTMIWEPPFSSTDKTFPCRVDRIEGPLSPPEHMYMLNHNLNVNLFDSGVLISDRPEAPTTNGVASITADANGCRPLADGLPPNFVMLDYVNIGKGLEAVNQLNGLA
ncbi:PLC-like phosphodiesterase [Marasmius fiardii PR-910]|nr:PLC-like phosphodiesterase [Marasmius fiardii PR-910]